MNRLLTKPKMLLFLIAGLFFYITPVLSTSIKQFNPCIVAYADEDEGNTLSTQPAEEIPEPGSHALNGSGDAAEDLTGTIETLITILASAGGIIFAFGLGSLFLAFKDDNPDAKARATTVIVAAILILTIKGVLTHLGVFSSP